jgi:hypothetical protein
MTMPEKEFIRRIVWLRDAPGTLSEKRECLIDKFKAGEVTETEYEAGLNWLHDMGRMVPSKYSAE